MAPELTIIQHMKHLAEALAVPVFIVDRAAGCPAPPVTRNPPGQVSEITHPNVITTGDTPMDMPKPTPAHDRLKKFVGTWKGEEKLSPSPWDLGKEKEYSLKLDMSQDGKNWQTMMDGKYSKEL